MEAEGASADLRGLYLLTGDQHADNHTTVDHAKPHCTSRELYKGVLADNAHGVFNGKVLVRPSAQKSDAALSNHNLLLSDQAQVDTKPELEIYADDVKCSHGTTVGQLDDAQIYYLRSRGIPAEESRRMLIRAFIEEMLEVGGHEALGERLNELVSKRLSQMQGVS